MICSSVFVLPIPRPAGEHRADRRLHRVSDTIRRISSYILVYRSLIASKAAAAWVFRVQAEVLEFAPRDHAKAKTSVEFGPKVPLVTLLPPRKRKFDVLAWHSRS
jgi:hypothetical protein